MWGEEEVGWRGVTARWGEGGGEGGVAWWQDIQHSTAVVQEVCGRTWGGGGGGLDYGR
jgi:hypothetical protein